MKQWMLYSLHCGDVAHELENESGVRLSSCFTKAVATQGESFSPHALPTLRTLLCFIVILVVIMMTESSGQQTEAKCAASQTI